MKRKVFELQDVYIDKDASTEFTDLMAMGKSNDDSGGNLSQQNSSQIKAATKHRLSLLDIIISEQ